MQFKPKGGYYLPTPRLARKIGDSLMILFTGATPIVALAPIDETTKIWVNVVLGFGALLSKVISNFFTESDSE